MLYNIDTKNETGFRTKGMNSMAERKLAFSGGDIEVYREGDKAIKVFGNSFSKSAVFYEAAIHTLVEETNLTIPHIHEIIKVDGKFAIVSDFIEGKTFEQLMQENPKDTDKYLEQMVDIQEQIHKMTIADVIKLKHKLSRQINSLDEIDNIKKYELLTRLDSMPKHSKLCHGNFGPENIILTDDGKLYIIDWVAASRGNASADVAKTYLKLSLKSTEMAEKYISVFCEKSGTAKRYVQEWLPIMAASQLASGTNSKEERELLLTWLDVVDYS